MAARIYQFPKTPVLEPKYRIPLYSDEEIEVTIICVNVFLHDDIKYNIDKLNFIDPILIIESLKSSVSSPIFSEKFKAIVKRVLKNVETI